MSKKYPTKAEVEAARSHFEHCARVLAANEKLWMGTWNAAPNPFIAVKEYFSTKQRVIRRPITKAWQEAKDSYNAIKPKKTAEEV